MLKRNKRPLISGAISASIINAVLALISFVVLEAERDGDIVYRHQSEYFQILVALNLVITVCFLFFGYRLRDRRIRKKNNLSRIEPLPSELAHDTRYYYLLLAMIVVDLLVLAISWFL